jgi:poly-gamma-glutamate capsule biosynthesis protein CapA/YwtB (metallophosphatase superfamily)
MAGTGSRSGEAQILCYCWHIVRRSTATYILILLIGCVSSSPPLPIAQPAATGKEPPPEVSPVPSLPPPPSPIRTLAQLRLGAVGDVLMHSAVKNSAAAHRLPAGAGGSPHGNDDGFGWLVAPIADLLSEPDLMLANLETPIAPRTGRGTRSMVFNAPVAAVRALAHAGVDAVNVANNHAFDQGRPGFLETLHQLDALEMPYVGAGPGGTGSRRLVVNGLSVELLGFSAFFNQNGNDCPPKKKGRPVTPCIQASRLDADRAVSEVKAASEKADLVVVSVHWGVEYASTPRDEEVELAHRLADAGAVVILGHHPHVLQPIEIYAREDGRTTVIAYSLGNFVSNQSRHYVEGVAPASGGLTRDGALLRVGIAQRDYGRGVKRIEVTDVDYVPLWTENNAIALRRKKRSAAAPSIRVVALDRALAEVKAEIQALADPIPKSQAAWYVELRQREELYEKRKRAIASVLGAQFQATLPEPHESVQPNPGNRPVSSAGR